MTKQIFYFFIYCLLCTQDLFSQDNIVEDLQATDLSQQTNLVTEETIKIVSGSQKIFILTNQSQALTMGDFLTLIVDDKMIARALVVKTVSESIGIKLIKLFSDQAQGKLTVGKKIKLIRGDDSLYREQSKPVVKVPPTPLTNPDLGNQDISFKDNDNLNIFSNGEIYQEKGKHIQSDNIINLSTGYFYGLDEEGSKKQYPQLSLGWSYQLAKNFLTEFSAGYSILKKFPAVDLDTVAYQMSIKAKYVFPMAFYSYFIPYIGYCILSTESDAGADNGIATAEQRARELELINDVERGKIIAGVTLLKRFVPGWFLKADVGLDVLNIGLALEY